MKRPSETELNQYKVFNEKDTNFTANARLWQSRWREKNKFPIGTYAGIEWGNLVEWDYAWNQKVNFLTNYTRKFVGAELPYLETTPVFNTERFIANLLSSQPLCFNIFCELRNRLEVAVEIFRRILPNLDMDEIIKIEFEHSPGRRNICFTDDNTAFDVFIEYLKEKEKYFLGIEVKYAELLKEDTAYLRKRYKDLTENSGMFKNAKMAIHDLSNSRFGQIWRDHLLAISMIDKYNASGKYKAGHFAVLYPKDHCEWNGLVKNYKEQYLNNTNNVLEIYLENIIHEIKFHIKEEWTNDLSERYIGK
jgi:hypothetical protein